MTSWKPSNCAETMWISPWWIFMALARQGTSGSDVATRNVGASGSNVVQSQGSDKLQESRASQDMLSKLAQAQLTINKCDMLIAKQALRIDELERVLRKFIQ